MENVFGPTTYFMRAGAPLVPILNTPEHTHLHADEIYSKLKLSMNRLHTLSVLARPWLRHENSRLKLSLTRLHTLCRIHLACWPGYSFKEHKHRQVSEVMLVAGGTGGAHGPN